jgi:RNA recognition motif-containing protein
MSDRLYIRGFPSTYTAEDLKSKLKIFGRIKKCYIVNGESKSYGIVRYFRPESAPKAINDLNNKVIDDITWYVAICEKKYLSVSDKNRKLKERKKKNYNKTLFLKDLPPDCNEVKLREVFEKHGNIESIKINKNIAYVTFVEETAAKAANTMEKLLTIDGTKVYVNKLREKSRITQFIRDKKYKIIEKKLDEKRKKLEDKMFSKYSNSE